MRELKPCKCGGDADLEVFEAFEVGEDLSGAVYDQVECLDCHRQIMLRHGDAPSAVEVWNVLMQEVRLPDDA